MKKAILMTGILSMMVLVSCKKEVKTTEVTPVDVDTVEVPAPPPPPVETENTDGTSVEMNSDGVKVDTKNGADGTKVEVKDGKAAVEVKK